MILLSINIYIKLRLYAESCIIHNLQNSANPIRWIYNQPSREREYLFAQSINTFQHPLKSYTNHMANLAGLSFLSIRQSRSTFSEKANKTSFKISKLFSQQKVESLQDAMNSSRSPATSFSQTSQRNAMSSMLLAESNWGLIDQLQWKRQKPWGPQLMRCSPTSRWE
jgi:hypothetical protein